MARNFGRLVFSGVAVNSTTKTVLRYASDNDTPFAPQRWQISFDSTSGTDRPVLVELAWSTTTTGGSGETTKSPVNLHGMSSPVAFQGTGAVDFATTEPTFGTNIFSAVYVHPQLGYTETFDVCTPSVMGVSIALMMRVTSTINVNCSGWFEFEE